MGSFSLNLQQAGTQACLEPILSSQLCYFFSTCNLTWCDNQSCFWINLAYFRKSFEKGFFFRRMGTTSYDNRKTAFNTEFLFIAFQILHSNFCISLVKFSIAGDQDFAFIGAKMRNVFGVNRRLHAETADTAKHIFKDTVQITIRFHRFFADTSVNHHDRYFAHTHSAEKIRPQFGFYRQKDTRHYSLNIGFRNKRQIQWEINNGICFRNNLVSHIITTGSNGRNQNFCFRHRFPYFFN